MMEAANLEVTVQTSPLGKREAVNYRWVGKSPYLRIDGRLLQDMGYTENAPRVQFGPYKLMFVEYEYFSGVSVYVRSDKLGALRVVLYKSTRLLDLAYRRLIITLAVWGLAEFSPAKIPSWQDIKFLKWLQKK